MKKRWKDLSPRTKALIVAGVVVDGTLKYVALKDLRHRDSTEVRGSKPIWATSLVIVNSAGALPLSYLLFGRHTEA